MKVVVVMGLRAYWSGGRVEPVAFGLLVWLRTEYACLRQYS